MAAGVAAALWLEAIGEDLTACLDAAHTAGLFVPARAAEAVATVRALERSWRRNAAGQPADAGDKATLGVG